MLGGDRAPNHGELHCNWLAGSVKIAFLKTSSGKALARLGEGGHDIWSHARGRDVEEPSVGAGELKTRW